MRIPQFNGELYWHLSIFQFGSSFGPTNTFSKRCMAAIKHSANDNCDADYYGWEDGNGAHYYAPYISHLGYNSDDYGSE